MERWTMFLDWQNQYCQNGYTTQGYLQIECNPYQISNVIFHRTRKKNLQFVTKRKRQWIAKAILRKKNGTGGTRLPDFQSILQSYNHQNSMIVAQKQKYRSIEQDRKSRDKPMHLWSPNLWQRKQEYIMEKRQSLQ